METGVWTTECNDISIACGCREEEGGGGEEEEEIRNCVQDCPNPRATECYDYYLENGVWMEGCEEVMTDCGCYDFGTELDCYKQALNYIRKHLTFEPNNACAVLAYVQDNFKCYTPEIVRPETPIIFPHLDLPSPIEGGNNDLPDRDDYDEDQRKPIWWYHTDHLGSSTYLTDNFGRPSHYYETLPFGEMMVEHNQSANVPSGVGYSNKYKFNGKELDDATQMYYYGARYYDPRISIFVSVDPLAEKFVGRSPYEYCFNNPINLVDPTGMSPTGGPGGPGGPPVKNLYIVLDYHKTGDDGNDAKRDIIRFEGMEEKGWTAFRANSVREANAIMASKYNDQKFDNIVIETHGSTGGSIENTYSALQSDNNNINSSTRITYKTLSAGGHTSTEALISITNYLNEDGNLIFNSCNLGMDSRQRLQNDFDVFH